LHETFQAPTLFDHINYTPMRKCTTPFVLIKKLEDQNAHCDEAADRDPSSKVTVTHCNPLLSEGPSAC